MYDVKHLRAQCDVGPIIIISHSGRTVYMPLCNPVLKYDSLTLFTNNVLCQESVRLRTVLGKDMYLLLPFTFTRTHLAIFTQICMINISVQILHLNVSYSSTWSPSTNSYMDLLFSFYYLT